MACSKGCQPQAGWSPQLHLPRKPQGRFSASHRACGLWGPGCQKVTRRMSITLRSGDQNRCPKGTLLPVKSSKVWHSHGPGALPASGPLEGIPASLYSSLQGSALCYATHQRGLGMTLLCQTSTASAGISQRMTNEHNTSH